MDMAIAKPLGIGYEGVVALAETIAQKTGLRTIKNFEPLITGMGGKIKRMPLDAWAAPDSKALEVRGPRDFCAYLAKEPAVLDRLLLASALGHYILHAKEGREPMAFPRFAKDLCSLEGVWFGMAIVVPDAPFALAEARANEGLEDQTIADLFSVPLALIALKRKLMASAGKAALAAKSQKSSAAA